MENIFEFDKLSKAFKQILSKKKGGGIDQVSLLDFENNLEKNLHSLSEELVSKNYIPEPYKRFYLKKETNGFRPISLLTIKDKIVQQAFVNHFNPIIDKNFLNTSYAYRPNKGHRKAINRIQDFINRKYNYFCPIDIDNFFDDIEREYLFNRCRIYFNDEYAIELLKMWIQIGSFYDNKLIHNNKGISQGGVVSPLLSNIYLHDFDLNLKAHEYFNVRYADNILLFDRNPERLKESLEFSENYLNNVLNLKLNTVKKSCISISEGFAFCGITFKNGSRKINDNKIIKIEKKQKDIIRKTNLEELVSKLNDHLEGIKRYYADFDTIEQIFSIEENIKSQLIKRFKREFGKGEIKLTFIRNFLNSLKFIGENNKEKRALYKSFRAGILTNRVDGDSRVDENALNRKLYDKRKKYLKKWYENLELVINNPFSFIGKSKNSLIIKKKNELINSLPVKEMKTLIISAKNTTISSEAIKLCVENNINIVYFDKYGRPFANIISANKPFHTITDEQKEAFNSEFGNELALKIINAKVKNQLNLLKYFTKNKKFDTELKEIISKEFSFLGKNIDTLKEFDTSLDNKIFRNKIMGMEGTCAVSYWKVFSKIIPQSYNFKKREHQGADNIVNNLLNYAYGILYCRILNSLLAANLDPNISFLHTRNSKKTALVYDMIEPFRAPVADRAVISLLNRNHKVKLTGRILDRNTKDLISKYVLLRLNNDFKYNNQLTSLTKVINDKSKELKNNILNKKDKFKPYIFKW